MSAAAALADSAQAHDGPRAKRRPRVAVACKRCKHRKQKCNGQTPCSNCVDFGLGEACEYPPTRSKPIVTTPQSQSQSQPQPLQASSHQPQQALLPPPPPPIQHQAVPAPSAYWDKPQQPLPRVEQHIYDRSQLPTPPGVAAPRPSIGTRVAALETVLQSEPTAAPSPKAVEVSQIVAACSPAALPRLSSSSSERHHSPYSPAVSTSSRKSQSHGVALKSVRDIISELRLASGREPPPSCSMTSMNQMIDAVKQARSFDISAYSRHKWEHLSLPPLRGAPSPPSDESMAWPPVEVGNQLLEAYIANVSPLHPVLQTPFLQLLHKQRNQLQDTFLTSSLHLIYAIGSTYVKHMGNTQLRGFDAEQHMDSALQHLEDVLLPQNIRSVQFLLFLILYSLRRQQVTNAWTYVDLAMRRCEEIGLHRRADPNMQISPLNIEMRKRVFWTVYTLDRHICAVLGKTPGIADSAIDIELPVDIDESIEDNAIIDNAQREALTSVPDMMSTKPTSLTSFIHVCRLRIMESQIRGSMASNVSMPWT